MNVFITGASSGIGAALAREFAGRGARLGVLARRGDLLDELTTTLPGRHLRYEVDVNDPSQLLRAAAEFEAATGGADIVIANAGISTGTLTQYAQDMVVIRQVIETNLLAAITTFHPFIGPMRRRGSGTLVGVASVAGVRGIAGAGAYCASKAALINYCESLRVELRSSGVRVVTIAPGFIATPMTANNPYPMPFLMDVRRFAHLTADAILRGDSFRIYPWQMAWLAGLLRLLPNWAFDRLMEKRARKRRLDAGPGAD